MLVRVVAPHFVAGLVIENGRCVEAAPILKWALNKGEDFLRGYIKSKGWRATVVPEKSEDHGVPAGAELSPAKTIC